MTSEKKEMDNDLERQSAQSPPTRSSFLILWLTFVLVCMGTIVLSHWNGPNPTVHRMPISRRPILPLPTHHSPPVSAPTSSCDPLSLRREWRTLSKAEKSAYQTSLQCLMYTSSVSDTSSRYGDFFMAYQHEDWTSSDTSRYLPWNRWFMHAFELAMRRECAYTGDMVYLDWTQDLNQDLIEHVKETSTGSEQHVQKPLGGAAIHTFTKTQHKSVDHLDEILSASSYDGFVQVLEQHISELSPLDFFSPEIPNDPMLLHQMQVDRLWWLWQQRNPDAKVPVSISAESININNLATPIEAAGVIDTETSDLCYRYL